MKFEQVQRLHRFIELPSLVTSANTANAFLKHRCIKVRMFRSEIAVNKMDWRAEQPARSADRSSG